MTHVDTHGRGAQGGRMVRTQYRRSGVRLTTDGRELRARLTQEEHDAVREAAEAERMSISSWAARELYALAVAKRAQAEGRR